MVDDLVLYIDRTTMSTLQGVFDLIQLENLIGYPSERWEAFNSVWFVTEHVPTGLPPPLDELTVFLGSIWTPIFEAFDDGENACVDGCDFWTFDQKYKGMEPPA